MPAVHDVHFGFRHVAAIGLRLRGIERAFIFAPNHQQARLFLAHPGLPLGVSIHVSAVIVEEVALNVRLARLVEKIKFIGPEIRVMALDVGIVADVACARGGKREKICAQRAFVGGAIGPESSTRFPIRAQAGNCAPRRLG